MLTLTRRYTFSAAHRLIGMRERHKCSRPHGHNYAVEITVAGPLMNGLIVDTGELDVLVGPVIARLDHNDLNALGAGSFVSAETGSGLGSILAQPTVENIALYLRDALGFLRENSTKGFRLVRLRVYESERTWAEIACSSS
jgi:6-pyruvoyltetrahydropterin/6-carboxytetrahydropterin synthase